MEFRVLGPLEVRHAGAAVPLGGPRQRAVLAALLLRANQLVTAQYLIEAVWETAPTSPESNLRTYVAGLRRRLQRAGEPEPRLVTGAGGYLFRVAPGELDVDTFHELVERARQARAGADLAGAARCYQDALRLWRGKPRWTGSPLGPRLWAALAQLEERRLRAVDQHAEARLALGDHDTVIDDLRRLVVEYPLRENLWARLMGALAEGWSHGGGPHGLPGGPPNAARGARHRTRRRAAGPPPADPGGARPGPPRPAPRVDRPPCPGSCRRTSAASPAGRRELAELDAALADRRAGRPRRWSAPSPARPGSARPPSPCTGRTGWRDRFPDGQLYVNLRGFDPTGRRCDPAEALRGFLDALGVPPHRIPADLDAQAALYRSLLAGRRVLVVLDNARDAEQVRPLLPGAPGCLVVVTSRNQLTGLVAARGRPPADPGPADRRRGARRCWPGGSAPDRVERRAGARSTRSSPGARGCRWRWRSSPPAPPPTRLPAGRARRRTARGRAAAWTRSTAATPPPTSGPSSPGRTGH